MPLTTYMQRHPRRDHGFTIPDPTLTRDLGIPNACNRCHADRSVEWAVEAAQRWYGNRLDRHTQRRARWIAAARAGSDEAISPLLALANDEPSALWRAVATGLLRRWADEEAVQSELVERTRDAHALVRGLAARALEPVVPFAHARVPAALEALLDDPRRSVRVEAAWALRRTVAPFSKAGEDLRAFLRHNRDQPTGRLQQAIYDIDRGYPKTALPHLRRAVVWDPHSAPLRQALAVCLSTLGQSSAAVRELQEACRLAPEEASYRFYLGLGLGELKRYDEAQAAFETAVELDPTFGRAWYNLGLARNSRGLAEDALEALATAGEIDPESPEPPYARATILHAMGRSDEAYEAARRCLEIVPNYEPARHLLGLLDDPSGE
jgi:tetratricopeptide (TPR) repeat protein